MKPELIGNITNTIPRILDKISDLQDTQFPSFIHGCNNKTNKQLEGLPIFCAQGYINAMLSNVSMLDDCQAMSNATGLKPPEQFIRCF